MAAGGTASALPAGFSGDTNCLYFNHDVTHCAWPDGTNSSGRPLTGWNDATSGLTSTSSLTTVNGSNVATTLPNMSSCPTYNGTTYPANSVELDGYSYTGTAPKYDTVIINCPGTYSKLNSTGLRYEINAPGVVFTDDLIQDNNLGFGTYPGACVWNGTTWATCPGGAGPAAKSTTTPAKGGTPSYVIYVNDDVAAGPHLAIYDSTINGYGAQGNTWHVIGNAGYDLYRVEVEGGSDADAFANGNTHIYDSWFNGDSSCQAFMFFSNGIPGSPIAYNSTTGVSTLGATPVADSASEEAACQNAWTAGNSPIHPDLLQKTTTANYSSPEALNSFTSDTWEHNSFTDPWGNLTSGIQCCGVGQATVTNLTIVNNFFSTSGYEEYSGFTPNGSLALAAAIPSGTKPKSISLSNSAGGAVTLAAGELITVENGLIGTPGVYPLYVSAATTIPANSAGTSVPLTTPSTAASYTWPVGTGAYTDGLIAPITIAANHYWQNAPGEFGPTAGITAYGLVTYDDTGYSTSNVFDNTANFNNAGQVACANDAGGQQLSAGMGSGIGTGGACTNPIPSAE